MKQLLEYSFRIYKSLRVLQARSLRVKYSTMIHERQQKPLPDAAFNENTNTWLVEIDDLAFRLSSPPPLRSRS